MIVFDTNVLSEMLRPSPDPMVAERLRQIPAGKAYTTALCQAEILVGLAVMAAGKKRTLLRDSVTPARRQPDRESP